jgi:hypothetical protein
VSVIELLGSSGSGKSFLLETGQFDNYFDVIFFTGEFYELRDYLKIPRFKKLVKKIIFSRKILFSPFVAMDILRKFKPLHWRVYLNICYKIETAKYFSNSGNKPLDIRVLVEEGPLQIFFNILDMATTLELIRMFPVYERDVIFVTADEGTIKERLKKRGHWRFRKEVGSDFIVLNTSISEKVIEFAAGYEQVRKLTVIQN